MDLTKVALLVLWNVLLLVTWMVLQMVDLMEWWKASLKDTEIESLREHVMDPSMAKEM